MTKNILVTGATGTIGREVAKRLAAQGASTRAGVRDRTKARKQFGDEIELVPFAFEDKRLLLMRLRMWKRFSFFLRSCQIRLR
jgi:uncharacterized protein YbjT (DUF2867 family)